MRPVAHSARIFWSVDPDKGYFIENPREGVYGVSDGQYWFKIFVGGTEEKTRRLEQQYKNNALTHSQVAAMVSRGSSRRRIIPRRK